MELPRDEDGALERWAWPGGYEIVYFDVDGCVLCQPCATINQETLIDCCLLLDFEERKVYCDECDEFLNEDNLFIP